MNGWCWAIANRARVNFASGRFPRDSRRSSTIGALDPLHTIPLDGLAGPLGKGLAISLQSHAIAAWLFLVTPNAATKFSVVSLSQGEEKVQL